MRPTQQPTPAFHAADDDLYSDLAGRLSQAHHGLLPWIAASRSRRRPAQAAADQQDPDTAEQNSDPQDSDRQDRDQQDPEQQRPGDDYVHDPTPSRITHRDRDPEPWDDPLDPAARDFGDDAYPEPGDGPADNEHAEPDGGFEDDRPDAGIADHDGSQNDAGSYGLPHVGDLRDGDYLPDAEEHPHRPGAEDPHAGEARPEPLDHDPDSPADDAAQAAAMWSQEDRDPATVPLLNGTNRHAGSGPKTREARGDTSAELAIEHTDIPEHLRDPEPPPPPDPDTPRHLLTDQPRGPAAGPAPARAL